VRLQTFRIRYCFGFVDSGKIDLSEPNNLVWILGRNSSGKSSVLRALEQLAAGKRPDEHPKFANFDPPPGDEYGRLEAEFSVAVGELSVRPVVQLVLDAFADMPVEFDEEDGRFAAASQPEVDALLEAVQEGYQSLLSATEEAGRVQVVKDYDAEYRILPLADEGGELRVARRRFIKDALTKGGRGSSYSRPPGQWVMNNSAYQFALSFEILEEAFYAQFPNVFLFQSRFAVGNDLPQVVTEDFLRGEKNQVASAFVTLLDPDVVRRWLRTNNLHTRQRLLDEMQARADELCDRVNRSQRRSEGEPPLLAVRLAAKDGLQVVVQTDGKQSFYEHLSDNTKFLFAYHLLAEIEDLAGAILLFDEPNAGFHPSAEGLVLEFLEGLTGSGNLVVLTTHSQHMIDFDRLAGVRLMGSDEEGALRVSNSIYSPASPGGDILALRPVTEAIGMRYAEQLVVKDKVVVTEGYTDMLYLRAFRRFLGRDADLNIAPLRGESQVGQFIPFLISQGMAFKVVLDSEAVKRSIQRDYPIEDEYFFTVPGPAGSDAQTNTGIEDLLTRNDFARLLQRYGPEVNEEKLANVSNSAYARQEKVKSALATKLYSDREIEATDFDQHSLEAFGRLLDFCASDVWFRI
jgi:energy-coupling factor transporter ATP-binding protein EcfA2